MIISKDSFSLLLCVGLAMMSSASRGMFSSNKEKEIYINDIKSVTNSIDIESVKKEIEKVKTFQEKEINGGFPTHDGYKKSLDLIAKTFKIDRLFNVIFKDKKPSTRKYYAQMLVDDVLCLYDDLDIIIKNLKEEKLLKTEVVLNKLKS